MGRILFADSLKHNLITSDMESIAKHNPQNSAIIGKKKVLSQALAKRI